MQFRKVQTELLKTYIYIAIRQTDISSDRIIKNIHLHWGGELL